MAGSNNLNRRREKLASGPMPMVTIIIVNWNGKHFLKDCLSSLAGQTYPSAKREVIVVDNGSTDGSAAFVQTNFSWARVISLGKNVGFAKGNNIGLRHARGQFIALLNNDTRAEPHWLRSLVDVMIADRGLGGVTSKILLRDHPSIINSTGLNLYRDGRGGDRGFGQTDIGQFDHEADVFGGCGASVLLRREMLDDVGFLDNRFFMYYEDLDLAWRGRLGGWRFAYSPQAVVYHAHCGTSGEWSPFFLYHVERNRVFVSLKNGSWWWVSRSVAVFVARALRQWYRVLTFQDCSRTDWRRAWTYIPAALSLLRHAPAMLAKRFLIRVVKRRVSDRALAPLLSAPPPRVSIIRDAATGEPPLPFNRAS